MSTLVSNAPSERPALWRAAGWYAHAFRLWRRAPLLIVLLPLLGLVAEGVLQLIPWAGVLISKLTLPMLGVGFLIGLDQLERGGRLRLSCLWSGWRQPRWGALWLLSAAIGLVVVGVQVACATAVFGASAVDAVLWGHAAAHPELATRAFQYVLLLPGLIPAALLSLVIPRFVFAGTTGREAITWGLATVFAALTAIDLAVLPQAVLFAVALSSPWALPLLLVLQPLGALVTYAAWRDLGTGQGQDERAPG